MMSDSCGYIVLDHGSGRPKTGEREERERVLKGRREMEKEMLWLRHRLQTRLLRCGEPINAEEMVNVDEILRVLEGFTDVEVAVLRSTKIQKVLKAISKIPEIPRDGEFMIKERSKILYMKWREVLVNEQGSPLLVPAVIKSGRIIVAFRGTYSIANTIVDLSTVPQEYVPYPDDPDNGADPDQHRFWDMLPRSWLRSKQEKEHEKVKCNNCTVHSGFWTSWQNTRDFIIPHLEYLHEKYPDYQINLVGHSLGGAVAALAGLEFEALG